MHCEYLFSDAVRYRVGAELPSGAGPVELSLAFERTGRHAGVARLTAPGRGAQVGRTAAHLASRCPDLWDELRDELRARRHRSGKRFLSAALRITGLDLRVVIELAAAAGSGPDRAFGAALKKQ